MESHDLRIFKHVAELQSVSKAAINLGYVQPNVSQIEKQHNQTLIVNSETNCIYRNKMLDFFNKSNFHDPSINRKELKNLQYQELYETIKIDFVIQRKKQQPESLKKFIHFLQRRAQT